MTSLSLRVQKSFTFTGLTLKFYKYFGIDKTFLFVLGNVGLLGMNGCHLTNIFKAIMGSRLLWLVMDRRVEIDGITFIFFLRAVCQLNAFSSSPEN